MCCYVNELLCFREQDSTIWLTSDCNCSLLLSGNNSLYLSTLSSPSVSQTPHQQRGTRSPLVVTCSPECTFLSPECTFLYSSLPSPIFCSPTTSHAATPLRPASLLLRDSSTTDDSTQASSTYSPTYCSPQPTPLRPPPSSESYLQQIDSLPTTSFSSSQSSIFCSPTESHLYSPNTRIGVEIRSSTPINHYPDQSQLPSVGTVTDSAFSISELLTESCCSQRCLAHLSVIDVERCRKWFQSKNTSLQNQFLLETFQISGSTDSNQQVTLEGKALCKKAFTSAVGISIRRYERVYGRFRDGAMQYQRKPTRRSEASKVSESKAWMKRFFSQIGDSMPHVNQIHLPHIMTKRDIYARMKKDLTDEGIAEDDVISQSYFYYIWNTCYKNVVIPVVRLLQLLDIHNHCCTCTSQQNRFSKCDLCTKFGKERMKPEARRAEFQEEYASHIRLIE